MSELCHHGVKGQQWGVKNGPPYPIDKNKGKVTISRGTKFSRISLDTEELKKGHAYVTYLQDDSDRYSGFFAAKLYGQTMGKKPVYQVEFESNKDLLSPSKKERVDTFLDLYKNDPVIKTELIDYYKKEKKPFLPKSFINKKFSEMDEEDLKNKGYDVFVRSLGGNDYIRDQYFRKLASEGYSFVVDDEDAGTYGKSPAIIFDRADVSYSKNRELSSKEIFGNFKKYGAKIDEEVNDVNELKHYGIEGQKWGVRRYQNPDGSLTPEGKERYKMGRRQEKTAYRLARKSDRYAGKDTAKSQSYWNKAVAAIDFADDTFKLIDEMKYQSYQDISTEIKKINKAKKKVDSYRDNFMLDKVVIQTGDAFRIADRNPEDRYYFKDAPIVYDPGKELKHYGIEGQKWGIRRYQNPDGTLTAEGKIHYRDSKTTSGMRNMRFIDNPERNSISEFRGRNQNSLTDDELKALMLRKTNEAKLKDLTPSERRKLNKAIDELGSDFATYKKFMDNGSGMVKSGISIFNELKKYFGSNTRDTVNEDVSDEVSSKVDDFIRDFDWEIVDDIPSSATDAGIDWVTNNSGDIFPLLTDGLNIVDD